MSLEVECKIYVSSQEHMQRRLAEAGAHVTRPRVHEHNIRYESPARDFSTNDIVLRLRQDQEIRLTYKAPASAQTGGAVSRLVLETTVGNLDEMDAILQHLGFMPYMIYEKYRTTYHLPDIPDTEIVLDEMPFGTFIEVEGTNIDTVLARLGLAGAHRILKSYAELFEAVRQQYQLSFANLTFENFTGISVDPAVFLTT